MEYPARLVQLKLDGQLLKLIGLVHRNVIQQVGHT